MRSARLFNFGIQLFGILGFLWLSPSIGRGAVTTAEEARSVVSTWLGRQDVRMGSPLSGTVLKVEPFCDTDQQVLYYVVSLDPAGLVIVPAEDGVEPIVGFFPNATKYDVSTDNPMRALVHNDVAGRVRAARTSEKAPPAGKAVAGTETLAKEKWTILLGQGGQTNRQAKIADISDVRVNPLVQTKWSQNSLDAADQVPCYNYYTPNQYLCGCVATTMAQVMRYHQYPTTGIGVKSFYILVDNMVQSAATRGGDGAGGPYAWDQMILDPTAAYIGGTVTVAQREAIGALCYDAGIAVNMEYAAGGSRANNDYETRAFTQTFLYEQAVIAQNNTGLNASTLSTAINSNLDAGFPCILGIRGQSQDGGHSVVCDGYGYDLGTLYHHMNMGWSGVDNAWYNLPTIDASATYTYTTVTACTYNIFPHGTGEILSGRITDQNGNPIAGVTVTATSAAKAFSSTATTNAKGIYAITGVPSATQITLTPVKDGWPINPGTVTTGTSSDGTEQVGNLWSGSCDFVAGVGTKLTLTVVVLPASSPAPGTVGVSPDQTYYTQGTVVQLTGTPADGYQVGSWSGTNNDGSKETTNTVTLDQSKTVTVTFETIPTPTPNPQPGGMCGGAAAPILIGLFLVLILGFQDDPEARKRGL